jgi:hypothetical protein
VPRERQVTILGSVRMKRGSVASREEFARYESDEGADGLDVRESGRTAAS